MNEQQEREAFAEFSKLMKSDGYTDGEILSAWDNDAWLLIPFWQAATAHARGEG